MSETDYSSIFSGHIRRLLEERRISQRDFSRMSGLSTAYLTALLNGTGNPTLKSMQTIARTFAIPLPLLLKPIESDEWQTVLAVASAERRAAEKDLPPGFGILEPVVLPEHKIFEVRQWARSVQKKLNSRL